VKGQLAFSVITFTSDNAIHRVHSVCCNFYRAMHVMLARYCYRKSSVRLSVCLSMCDVDISWAYRLV